MNIVMEVKLFIFSIILYRLPIIISTEVRGYFVHTLLNVYNHCYINVYMQTIL